jgi:hypothetical protein
MRDRLADLWRRTTTSTKWGCLLLAAMIAIAVTVIDPRAKQVAEMRRLRTLLAARHVDCQAPNYWWNYPKGRSVLNCSRFEIDVFTHAELATFLHRQKAHAQADLLKELGVSSYVVAGPRWLVTTPSRQIASAVQSATHGRILVISEP